MGATKTQRVLNQLKKKVELKTPIATDMFIPNQSGDHSAGTVKTTPTDDLDIANKKYVDSQKYDNFDGSDCTGADQTTNRTLDVPNGVGQVIVERKFCHPVIDYTVSGTTITFLIRMDNRMKITVFR